MKIDYAALAFVFERSIRVAACAAKHGQDNRKDGLAFFGGSGEGDMDERSLVYDCVDGLEIIFPSGSVSVDSIGFCLFPPLTFHGPIFLAGSYFIQRCDESECMLSV